MPFQTFESLFPKNGTTFGTLEAIPEIWNDHPKVWKPVPKKRNDRPNLWEVVLQIWSAFPHVLAVIPKIRKGF